jgi:Glycosyl transferases group 1
MPKNAPFDEQSYLALNPDVAAAVRKGAFASGYAHWKTYGQKENRLCRAPQSTGEFDELEYLLRYSDVAQSIRTNEYRSAYEHWIKVGVKEGRSAHRLAHDNERYVAANPDVASAIARGFFDSGLDHWRKCGRYEQRPGVPRSWLQPPTPVNLSLPSGVNHFGIHGSPSGLGNAADGYSEALTTAGIPLNRIETPDWSDPTLSGAVDVSAAASYRINLIHQNYDVMPRWGARYGDSALPGRYNIGLWVWELQSAYAQAHASSRPLHEIWVPSRYVAHALSNVSDVPVFCIPYVVEPKTCQSSFGRSHFGIAGAEFVFLYTFDLSSGFARKNPLALLYAFRMAFKGDKSVLLVLKYTRAERDPAAALILENAAAACPNVRTIARTMPDDENQNLLLSADCFVSPHRSEGFGLNIATALFHEKPVITTGYSGNLDFSSHETAELIDYSLVPVGPGNDPYDPHYVWADPDVHHLAELLERVRSNPERVRRKAENGRRQLVAQNSRHAIGALVRERLHRVGMLD